MENVEQLSVSLRPEVADLLRAAAAEAGYGSVGEAVGHTVEEWLEARTAAEDTEQLGRLVQEGRDSGPGDIADIVCGRLRVKHGLKKQA